MTKAKRKAVVAMHVAGEDPEAIAAKLGLPLDDVRRALKTKAAEPKPAAPKPTKPAPALTEQQRREAAYQRARAEHYRRYPDGRVKFDILNWESQGSVQTTVRDPRGSYAAVAGLSGARGNRSI
ncbi:MAG TPA: hypothetical protein VHP33_03265 [Polyangiaceae bacterium]|nr:hypothetical protein [Polyangiaceae bacterium]